MAASSGRDYVAGAGDQQRSQRRLEPRLGPGRQGLRLAQAHAEDVGEVLPGQVVAQVQLDDLPGRRGRARRAPRPVAARSCALLGVRRQVRTVSSVSSFADVGPGRPVRGNAGGGGIRCGPRRRARAGAGRGSQQPVQLGVGDDERVQDRVVGVGWIAKQAAAVGMQGGSIPVIDGAPARPTRQLGEGRHHLCVSRALTVSPGARFTERLIGTRVL